MTTITHPSVPAWPIPKGRDLTGLRLCTRCIYDETIPGITFDGAGMCVYCRTVDDLAAQYQTGTPADNARLMRTIEEIKLAGRGKRYDCVLGVSGGTDSSYMLLKASAAEKLRVVMRADACLASGQRGALEAMLREEGIYSSLFSTWRVQHGAVGITARRAQRARWARWRRLCALEARTVAMARRRVHRDRDRWARAQSRARALRGADEAWAPRAFARNGRGRTRHDSEPADDAGSAREPRCAP